MKKVIITLLCLAILAGGGKFGYDKYKKSKDDKRIVDVVEVNLITQDFGWYDYEDGDRFDGNVVSSNTQTVGLDAQDKVKEVKVKVGDYVKKGDVILELDTTLLELETAQKKAEMGVIEINIKKAEKELARLKTLLPSELKPYTPDPVEPDYPDEPDDSFEESSSEEETSSQDPVPELKLIDTLGSFRQVSEVSEDGTFYFNMTHDAKVAKPFMSDIKSSKRRAVLNVYSEKGVLLYMWVLDGSDEKLAVYDWNVSDGVSFFNGMISYDGSGEGRCGTFYVYTGGTDDDSFPDDDSLPDESIPDDFGEEDYDYDFDDDDYEYEAPLNNDNNDNNDKPVNENYMYTRAELDKKIRLQEDEIKDLKLDLRTKKLEYENSAKKVNDGKVVAKIDGIVAKIGKETLSGEADDEYYEDEDYEGEDYEGEDFEDEDNTGEDIDPDLDIDESLLDSSYIIIRGDDATNVEFSVGELKLADFKEGTQLTGMNYQTGEQFTVTVTGIKDEPESYYSYNWNDNPNSSTFTVTGRVEEEISLVVDSWIELTPIVDYDKKMEENEDSSSIYLPMWYLHREGSGYYVMKADENGLLKKQYVRTGKELYGMVVEIKGGLSVKDKICFPYGKDVKEGIKTHETDTPVSLYDY